MRYACLLRGISPMNAPSSRLRTVFEGLQFTNVQPIISSGNVVFDSDETDVPALEKRIEERLLTELDVRSMAIILTPAQLKHFIDSAPFGKRTHGREMYLTVTFMKRPPAVPPAPYKHPGGGFEIISYDADVQAICAVNNVALTKTPDFMARVERMYGKDITTRTWNTMAKIAQKL